MKSVKSCTLNDSGIMRDVETIPEWASESGEGGREKEQERERDREKRQLDNLRVNRGMGIEYLLPYPE